MSRRMRWFAVAVGAVAVGLLLWRALVKRPSDPFPVRDFVAPVSAQSADAPRPALRRETVTFASPGDEPLQMDLVIPAGDGPFPAVVCLHGGGWVSGDREQMKSTIEVLARRGYVAAAPDYRLAPKHPFPACVEDCKASVRWLRANAGKHRINPDRIGASGLSAGAHLACLLAVTDSGDGLDGVGDGDRSSAIQAAVGLASPLDLCDETIWTEETVKGNLTPLLGGPPRERMDLCRKASPMHYARAGAPLLLIHGSEDRVIPIRQAHEFAEKVKRSGGSARVLVLAGQGHTFNGFALLKGIDSMLSFLDENLKK